MDAGCFKEFIPHLMKMTKVQEIHGQFSVFLWAKVTGHFHARKEILKRG